MMVVGTGMSGSNSGVCLSDGNRGNSSGGVVVVVVVVVVW